MTLNIMIRKGESCECFRSGLKCRQIPAPQLRQNVASPQAESAESACQSARGRNIFNTETQWLENTLAHSRTQFQDDQIVKLNIVLSTTQIENGSDVDNASRMPSL